MDALARLAQKLCDIEAASHFEGDVARQVDAARRLLVRVADEHAAECARLQSTLATVLQEQPLRRWQGLASRLEAAAGRVETAVNLASKTVPIVTESAPVLERVG